MILVAVIVAQGGVGAWANKLQAQPNAVAPSVAGSVSRPQGTVIGNPSVPVGGVGQCALIATYCVESNQPNLIATALTELPAGLAAPEGGAVVLTRIIQISEANGETKSKEDIFFTLDPALGEKEFVAYWSGTEWVTLALTDGKYIIPKEVTLPVTVAVFTKP